LWRQVRPQQQQIVLRRALYRILGWLDLDQGAAHFVCFFIQGAVEGTFDGYVLAVGTDDVVNFNPDVGAFEGGGLGFYAEYALRDIVDCRGEGSVRSFRDMPDDMVGSAIGVEGAAPVAGELGLGGTEGSECQGCYGKD
jgi:hypothetical protein